MDGERSAVVPCRPMSLRTFRLSATVISSNLDGVRAPITRVLGPKVRVERTEQGLRIEVGAVVGVDARELNRRLLSALRSVEKATRLRSEWTSEGKTERFSDYVFLKNRPVMNHGQAGKWLRAIGGTSEVVRDADGRDFVVVSVESVTKGAVSRRMSVDGSSGREREEALRHAFVRACEELRLALC